MEIGITVGEVRGPATLEEITTQVRAAASAGFATAWSAQALGWDALTALAVTGSRIPGVGLGTAVVPVPQRHSHDPADLGILEGLQKNIVAA